MARRKDLTALAALGTLGYMLSKRGDKKDDKSTAIAAERRITADREATDQKTSGDTEDMFIEPGSGPHDQQFRDELPGASAPSRVSATVKKPVVKTTAKPAPKTPAYVQSYTEDMMEADNPRSVKAEKTSAPAKAAPAAKLTSSSRVPTPEQASANRAAAAEKVKGMGSSVADYFSNLETPAKRKAREQQLKEERLRESTTCCWPSSSLCYKPKYEETSVKITREFITENMNQIVEILEESQSQSKFQKHKSRNSNRENAQYIYYPYHTQ